MAAGHCQGIETKGQTPNLWLQGKTFLKKSHLSLLYSCVYVEARTLQPLLTSCRDHICELGNLPAPVRPSSAGCSRYRTSPHIYGNDAERIEKHRGHQFNSDEFPCDWGWGNPERKQLKTVLCSNEWLLRNGQFSLRLKILRRNRHQSRKQKGSNLAIDEGELRRTPLTMRCVYYPIVPSKRRLRRKSDLLQHRAGRIFPGKSTTDDRIIGETKLLKFLVDEEEIEVYGFDLSSTVKTGKRQYFMYLINSPYSFHWFTFCAHVFNVWEFNPRKMRTMRNC